MKAPLKVCIIGAGPAGLTLALCLVRRGDFRVTLVEQRGDHAQTSTYEPGRSYAIDVTGHGLKAMRYAGVVDRKDLMAFKGIRVVSPFSYDDGLMEGGSIGSRGDICRLLLKELRLRAKSDRCTILFNTEAEVTNVFEGGVQLTTGDAVSQHVFDLVVASDGAGSQARTKAGISFTSGRNDNHSTMIRMDQNARSLDSVWLQMLGLPPVMQVAGAVNGPGGPTNPYWFCQITTKGPLDFNGSVPHATKWLKENCPLLAASFVSPKAIEEWVRKTESVPSGRWRLLDSFYSGRLVFIGDAAASHPPVGQGLNAAMESATVLDMAIGKRASNLTAALKLYEANWKRQAEALSIMSRDLDMAKMGLLRSIRMLIFSFCGVSSLQNAKSSFMSYDQCVNLEKNVTIALAIFFAILTVLAFFVGWRYS